jgi:hypothetical protein
MPLEYVIIDSPGGGIGNLIFQHNCGYAIAKKYNATLIIRSDIITASTDTQRPPFIYYKELFKHANFLTSEEIQEKCINKKGIFYQEPEFKYHDIDINNTIEVIVLKGFFQSYKYFENYIDDIRESLKSNISELYSSIENQYSAISPDSTTYSKTVCVHVRRTDFTESWNTIIKEEYYEKAINILNITDKYILYVFSDDVNVIKDWDLWKKYKTIFVSEQDALRSLYLMSMCNNFIIANSTMSLIAYYLRKHNDAKIILPSKWFGINGPHYDFNDIIQSYSNHSIITL